METSRLLFRERTRDLIAEMLFLPVADQLRFFGFETEKELEEKLERIDLALGNKRIDYRIFDLIEKNSKVVIGSCGFHNWKKEHDRAETGYGLHAKFRKQGYMREALQKVFVYGFEEMKLNRIEAMIAPENEASIRIIQHFGFQKEGVLREHYKGDTGFEDSLFFSLLKSEFEKIAT